MARSMQRIGGTGSAVQIRQISNGTNLTGVQLRIDYTRVPAPDPYYVADYARLAVNGAVVQVIFGKLEGIDGFKLRNKLEVNVPAYAFMAQWIDSKAFFEGLRQGLHKGLFPAYKAPQDIDELTEKVQTLHSNNALITSGGSECCIDFYYLSPRDVRNSIEKHDDVQIEGLVRVIVDSSILISLADNFDEIAGQIESFVPKPEEVTEMI
jgi:hypothetical protein